MNRLWQSLAVTCLLVAGGLTLFDGWHHQEPVVPTPFLRPPLGHSLAVSSNSMATENKRPLMNTVEGILEELTRRWGAADAEGRKLLSKEFELWAEADPAEFVRALPLELHGETFFHSALLQWTGDAPVEVLKWFSAYPDRERFSHVSDLAVTTWVRTDPGAAVKWVLDQPPDGDLDHLLGCLAMGFAEKDPISAGDFILEIMPSGPERQQALEGVAALWAQRDPAASATWALSLPDSGNRHAAIGLVLYPWFDQAPEAVDAWVRGVPDAGERDLIRSRLVSWQIEKNPRNVPDILAQISSETLRHQLSLNLVQHCARDDFAFAMEWALRETAPAVRTRLVQELAAVAGGTPIR